MSTKDDTRRRPPTLIAVDATAPVLVFGGPYSNVRAVEAMRRRAATLGLTAAQTICTGDVVAYCAEPEETIAAMRDWGCHMIAGNCEEQLASGAGDCGCGFAEDSACERAARDWFAFANGQVSQASRNWMAALPKTLRFDYGGRSVRVVHGGVTAISRFVFASDTAVLAEELIEADTDLVIAGHAGLPFIAEAAGRVWFNPGVLGMPANDGTPDAWFGLMRAQNGGLVLSTHRLPYDHRRAAEATRRAGHADGYANALDTGLWPSLDVLPAAERVATGVPLAEMSWTMDLTKSQP